VEKTHNEEFHDLYSSPTIVRVIKWNEMGGACSSVGGERRVQGFGGKPERKRPLGDPAVVGRIILRWIFK
jgi:hypothetical protein